MSVQTEIDRIITAVEAAHEKVAEKGGTTARPYLVGNLANAIDSIPESSDPVLQAKTVTPTTSQQSVTPDSGYDGLSKVTVNAMPTATQATPSISVSSAGLITASATQTAGYVAAGTKSATKQLTTQGAKTITPSKSSQTAVAKDRYTTGAVTVAAIPSQYITTTDATAVATDIVSGKTAYVNGSKVTGSNPYAKTATDTEVATQADLISQIKTALQSGGGGSSGGGVAEVCSVTVDSNITDIAVYGSSDGPWSLSFNGQVLFSGDEASIMYSATLPVAGCRWEFKANKGSSFFIYYADDSSNFYISGVGVEAKFVYLTNQINNLSYGRAAIVRVLEDNATITVNKQ